MFGLQPYVVPEGHAPINCVQPGGTVWLTAEQICDLERPFDPPAHPPLLGAGNVICQPDGRIITDPSSPYCGEPVWVCMMGDQIQNMGVITGNPPEFLELDLSNTELNIPGGEAGKTFQGELRNFIIEHAVTPIATVQDVIDAAVVAGLPPMTCKGSDIQVPAAATDVCAYKVHRIPCSGSYLTDPTDAASAVTVADDADDSLYVGGLSVNSDADDAFAGINPATPVAPGGAAVSVWCLQYQTTLSKAELAAL